MVRFVHRAAFGEGLKRVAPPGAVEHLPRVPVEVIFAALLPTGERGADAYPIIDAAIREAQTLGMIAPAKAHDFPWMGLRFIRDDGAVGDVVARWLDEEASDVVMEYDVRVADAEAELEAAPKYKFGYLRRSTIPEPDYVELTAEGLRLARGTGTSPSADAKAPPEAAGATATTPTPRVPPDQRNEKGFIVEPADPSVYVPVSELLGSDHCPASIALTVKGLTQILDANTETIRQWRPRSQRRSVHIGDWLAHVKQKTQARGDDQEPTPDEIEARTAEVREAKRRRK